MAVPEARARPSKEEEEEAPRNKKRSSILGSLREAIRKRDAVDAAHLRRPARRGLSFGPRAGLLDLDVEGGVASPAGSSRTSRSASMGTATTRSLSRTSNAASPGGGGGGGAPRRTASSSSGRSPASSAGDDDIDQRAEHFIANFYRQLQMERQVSLQLRYVRGDSWDRTP
ncbi:hypothetical protein C2845_PM13G18920 [Panicum miliaceum]|uniref:Uncharacterized protein n=1 Tax=Panicum miliaceum TaxID=4540 RepID=A0A3L6RHD5_PANMI|nr:hypothetical protein C2845_PM13G18920 [Panicum miliaceum]